MDTPLANFDHYRVARAADGSFLELGRGAMGITYQAEDINLGTPVALKVINAVSFADEVSRKRFVSEARSAARLRHPNVASIHHLGERETQFFYAMEFIEGETVQALVERDGPLPPRIALRIALQVASALEAAARAQLVHRDIKPANLMVAGKLDDEYDGPFIKVIDFGLVRPTGPASSESTAAQNGFAGTPQFASPEQAEEREPDIRSDIYSLGCTLWFLLTGSPPFSGSMASVFAQHLNSEPPFATLSPLPAPVRTLLERMLQKNPADRPQTPSELMREISHCRVTLKEQDEKNATNGVVPIAFERPGNWLSRHRLAAAAVLAVCLVPVVVLGVIRPGIKRQVAETRAEDRAFLTNLEPGSIAEVPAPVEPPAPVVAEEPAAVPATVAANPVVEVQNTPSTDAPTPPPIVAGLVANNPTTLEEPPPPSEGPPAEMDFIPETESSKTEIAASSERTYQGLPVRKAEPAPETAVLRRLPTRTAQRTLLDPPGTTVGYIPVSALGGGKVSSSRVMTNEPPPGVPGQVIIPIVTVAKSSSGKAERRRERERARKSTKKKKR